MKPMQLLLTLLLGFAANNLCAAYQFNNQFFGGPNQSVFTLSGDLNGFVAARQSVPVEYMNEAGDLECHVLFRKTANSWQSMGDIGSINNGQDCPLITGGAFPIQAVEAFGPDTCIGGEFTNLGGVAGLSYFACYSDSLGWYQPNGIGNGPNGPVYSIDSDALNLYLGGAFTEVDGGTSARRVVKTDGLFWTPLYTDNQQTSDGVNSTVQAVFSTTSFLVIQMGNSTITWNPSVPEFLVRGTHNGNAASHPDVVINGSTLTVSTRGASLVSGDPGGSISDFNIGGEEWSEFGMTDGIDTDFGQLAFGLGPLYATGDFTSFDPDARGLAWYNSITWEAAPDAALLGDLATTPPTDLQQGGSQFCVLTQGVPTDAELYWNTQVCYDGSNWQGDNQAPISNIIQTIGEFNNRIIHGGDFNAIGDQISPFVGELGSTNLWTAISQLAWSGAGSGHVRHLQVFDGELYATGLFDSANGVPVQHIAKYDGTNWSPVITGLNALNGHMTVWNNQLIIQGTFNAMGPILTWDGSNIGEAGNFNQGGIITDLSTHQNDLILANLAAGTSRLYAYDGGTWQTFAGTLQGVINTTESVGNHLYVGGDFSSACNTVDFVFAENIFRWDGTGCDALGAGVTNSGPIVGISDIVPYGNGVIVTGRFNQAGGQAANSLAIWNGNNWLAMDQGLVDGIDEGQGNALWMKDNALYVAGYFEQAGAVLSHNFASVDLDPLFKSGFE